MISYKSSFYLSKYIRKQKLLGKTIAFVPTMGALHLGHISLVKAAKEKADIVVCSIFVNPTQFNKQEDLLKYPRTIDADSKLLKAVSCDVLFIPSIKEMYPKGTNNGFQAPDLGNILDILEGEFRPGHFEGMMQVVSLLLDKVNCDHLFMGLKDYQQFAICSLMIKAQKRKLEIHGMPTIRESSGLAMSSRNERLSAEGRKKAASIYASLNWVKENKDQLQIENLKQGAIERIESQDGMQVEYLEIVDKDLLRPSQDKKNWIVLCAVWLENIRLIDNLIL
ncbi:MAG: pantoate--beta-alanine ligase [Chitinophagales bacterium]